MPRPKPTKLDPAIFGMQVINRITGEVFPDAAAALEAAERLKAQEAVSAARELKLGALTELFAAALAGKVGEKAIKIVAEACYENSSKLALILSDSKAPAKSVRAASKTPSAPPAKKPAPPVAPPAGAPTKRGRGRPAKAAAPVAPPAPPAGAPPKRGRGRPAKAAAPVAPPAPPAGAPPKRGRGRPAKAGGTPAKKASATQSTGTTASAPAGDHSVPAPVTTAATLPPPPPMTALPPPPPPSQADFERVQAQSIPQTLPPPPPFAAIAPQPPPLPVAADPFAQQP